MTLHMAFIESAKTVDRFMKEHPTAWILIAPNGDVYAETDPTKLVWILGKDYLSIKPLDALEKL